MRFDLITVALNGNPVALCPSARQALMRRLQHVQETVQLDHFTVADAWRPVTLMPGQRAALLLVLEVWSLGPDDYEPIPRELLDLRNALLADLDRSD